MEKIHKRVLIVDDEEDITWTLTKKLSKDSDKFDVTAVNSSKEAMEVLDQLPVDIVVTDVRMPEISGLELLRRIKGRYPSTKVIIMTAYGSTNVREEASTKGCFQYIEKPFEINDLREIILEGLREEKGFQGNVSDFQLSDLIQLNCLGRLTVSLSVKHENVVGTIYFSNGSIIHAEVGDLVGEDAFHQILSWRGGEFSGNKDVAMPAPTISKGWQSLLLESMRRADESMELDDPEREQYWRFKKIESVLSRIKKSKGVKHILIHPKVGSPIFYSGSFGKEEEKITALGDEISLVIKSFESAKRILNNQDLEFWEVKLEHQAMMLYKIPYQDAFITILGDNQINRNILRLEIGESLPLIAQLL